MENKIPSEKIELTDQCLEIKEIMPYDQQYPITLLNHGFRKQLMKAENAIEQIYQGLVKESPVLAQVQQAMTGGFRLVVDADEKTIDGIKRGVIKLASENSGKLYAQVRNAKGQYGRKLPIKKEYYAKDLDPVKMANALQMRALQDQVQSISDQIVVIDQRVKEVLRGQQNDRIGRYYSGLALYMEARTLSDLQLKKALVAQSLSSLSDATFQLSCTLRSDIRYLSAQEYQSTKGKTASLIDHRMDSINEAFAFIHQSSLLRAAIYCNENEIGAMAAVLSEYSNFIEGTIAQNSTLLAQCDISDTGTEKGIWKSRAKLKLDTSSLHNELTASEKAVYLSVIEE